MTFRALLYAYILGGLTFLPLLLATVVGLAWTLLPKIDEAAGLRKADGAADKSEGDQKDKKAVEDLLAKKHEEISEGSASGTFAVLRKYDFQAANAALAARNNATAGATGASTAGDNGLDASKESESVYQSMYRSVFDRGKGAGQSNSVLAKDEAESNDPVNARTKQKATPVNVFYIVIRHGHLILYDSVTAQTDPRHVISLAHHSISIAENGSPPGTDEHSRVEREVLRDGDLFIKRTAIVLTPTDLPNGHKQPIGIPARPFYLFAATCSEKEDFYHSLLYTRLTPPTPEPLDPNDAIKLQSTLHSSSLTPETRALNALVGRIFLGLYHTDRAKQFIQSKVEKKISRVQKPAFIASLALRSIDLGDSAPVLSNLRLKDLHISGDTTIAVDIKYTGCIKLTFAATAKLDLGQRFKVRTVDLVLATSLQRLQGHLLVRIKPPPSNRLWFCFESAPEMDIKVEPVVSQRQITYTFILRQIEDRIRAVILETLVKPNWDDVPWFDTRGQSVRGGIWRDEGGEAESGTTEKLPTGAEVLKERNEKTKSMPVLPGMSAETDSSATSSGSETVIRLATSDSAHASDAETTLKRRSVASLPTQSTTPPPDTSSARSYAAPPPPPPLRSPSLHSSSTPSVALDENPVNVDPTRNVEAAPQAQRRWRLRAAAQQVPSRKEAVDAIREMRDRAGGLTAEKGQDSTQDRPSTSESHNSSSNERGDPEVGHVSGPDSPSSSQTSFANRSLKSAKRTDTDLTTDSTASKGTTSQQRKQNILAATAAATNAARNWSWNAYQNAKKNSPGRTGSTASQQPIDGQSQPIGRGQPLPPPGIPLPGPNKGLFGSFGGSVKRKPVLPPRKATMDQNGTPHEATTTADTDQTSKSQLEERNTQSRDSTLSSAWPGDEVVETPVSDEFGPWRENSGAGFDLQSTLQPVQDDEDAASDVHDDEGIRVTGTNQLPEQEAESPHLPQTKKGAPPLPPRRSNTRSDQSSQKHADAHNSNSVDPNDAPPARSAEQAEAKFTLGADVGEEDFEGAPAHDENMLTTDGSEHEDGTDGKNLAVVAPIDETDYSNGAEAHDSDREGDESNAPLEPTHDGSTMAEHQSVKETAESNVSSTNQTL